MQNENSQTPIGLTAMVSKIPPSARRLAVLTPAHVDAIMACIDSAHSVLDAILGMNIPTLRAIPILYYVRMQYCMMVLIHLDISTRIRMGSLAKILDASSMKVECYMIRLVPQLELAIGEGVCRPASMFLKILLQVRSWYHEAANPRSTGPQKGPQQRQPVHQERDGILSTQPPTSSMNSKAPSSSVSSYQDTNGTPRTASSTSDRSTSDLSTPAHDMSNLSMDPINAQASLGTYDNIAHYDMYLQAAPNFAYFPLDLGPMLQPQFDMIDDIDMSMFEVGDWMPSDESL